MNEGNNPAFPTMEQINGDEGARFDIINSDGITIRDYFAIRAFQGAIPAFIEINHRKIGGSTSSIPEVMMRYLVSRSYEIADMFLEERKK